MDDGIAKHIESEGEEGISGTYAKGAWGVLVTLFGYARSAKARTNLRVRTDSPCDDVKPPMKEGDLRKIVLRPSEWLELAGCEGAPLARRETYSVMLYAYARPGEGRVWTWERDVDFELGEISITHAWDYAKKREKAYPKTDAGRRKIPILPGLRPLLLRMHARAGGRALVLPWMSSLGDETAMSKYLRADMQAAGVERNGLLDKQYGVLLTHFRSLRDWGITWRLWSNENPFVVRKQGGHKDLHATNGYVGDIDQLRAHHGVPFPPLPQSLLDAVGPAPAEDPAEGDPSNGGCERRELNPHGSYPART